MSGIYEDINRLYTRIGFTEKYGSELWISVIIIIIFIIAITYFHIMNNIKPILADWENQKCNPAVIPFAGLINNGPHTTPLEFTGQNFTYCTQSILTNIVGYAFQPFYYLMKTMTDAFSELINAINGIRAEFDKIRNTIKEFSTDTMGRALNITIPIVKMIIGIKDMGAKMLGVLSASLYTLMGSYLTMKSFFLFIMHLIILILIIIAGTIAGLIVANVFAFGALSPVIAVDTAIMILILVPTIMIKILMDDVMDVSPTGDIPSVPGCFEDTTPIKMKHNKLNKYEYNKYEYKNISDVEVNDILFDETVVTGIMKLSSENQSIYKLNNIIVTGEHRVFHHDNGFIKVKNHPDSILVHDFNKPFVYCLITNTKMFTVGETLFSDWDDINDDIIDKLNLNCVTKGYIPPDFTNEDIHAYLDNGLHKDTKIKLKNGTELTINNIKVNDILVDGEKVLATVKIDATKLKYGVQDYCLDNKNHICCSNNININNYLGGVNTFDLYGIPISNKTPELYLYQLLTTSGKFNANGINVGDYNTGIDRFL